MVAVKERETAQLKLGIAHFQCVVGACLYTLFTALVFAKSQHRCQIVCRVTAGNAREDLFPSERSEIIETGQLCSINESQTRLENVEDLTQV